MATSKDLLDKVYTRLDKIEIDKLSLSELKDFLGVVQQGRFLETIGQAPSFGLGGCAYTPFNGSAVSTEGSELEQ